MNTSHKKKKLIIISDLWGREKSTWISQYYDALAPEFEIQFFDACELSGINPKSRSQKELHKHFINDGIDVAVNKLLELIKDEVYILAFSIGGTIAWKATLKGLRTTCLVAVSSTRLRLETVKPACAISLIYGELDTNKPSNDWFNLIKVSPVLIKMQEHSLYSQDEFTKEICDKLIHD